MNRWRAELESEIECLRKEVSYCEGMMVWGRDFVFWSAKRSVCLDKIETIEAEIRRRGMPLPQPPEVQE